MYCMILSKKNNNCKQYLLRLVGKNCAARGKELSPGRTAMFNLAGLERDGRGKAQLHAVHSALLVCHIPVVSNQANRNTV